MRETREYDFNIYCPEADVITLNAYRLHYVGDGMFQTDYSDWQTIRFNANMAEHKGCVEYLLDLMGEGTPMYEDLDWWGADMRLLQMYAPEPIAGWLESLPAYEVEEDADLIENAKEVGKPYGEM